MPHWLGGEHRSEWNGKVQNLGYAGIHPPGGACASADLHQGDAGRRIRAHVGTSHAWGIRAIHGLGALAGGVPEPDGPRAESLTTPGACTGISYLGSLLSTISEKKIMNRFNLHRRSVLPVLAGALLMAAITSASAQDYPHGMRGPYYRNNWYHHHWGDRYPRPDHRGPLQDQEGWYHPFAPQRRWWEEDVRP